MPHSISFNQNQHWSPQGDPNQQYQQQQLQGYGHPGQTQSPQQPGYEHDVQSLSYSDGNSQVHEHMSNTSWSNSAPDNTHTPSQSFQMPQIPPMNMIMGGMSMSKSPNGQMSMTMPNMHTPSALPPPGTPYQAVSPPPQQQQQLGCYPQQGYQQLPPWSQRQPLQLTAPQSPYVAMLSPQGLPYQQTPQQTPPYQLGLPQPPSTHVNAPAPAAQGYNSPGPGYSHQLQVQQTQLNEAIRAMREQHEAARRDLQVQRQEINKRLNQASDQAKDRELERLRAERAVVETARREEAQGHNQEMADLMRANAQHQQTAQTPAFDMNIFERIVKGIQPNQPKTADIRAVIAAQWQGSKGIFATKEDIDSAGSAMQQRLMQMPQGASKQEIAAAVRSEVANTINPMVAQHTHQLQQQWRPKRGGELQQTPWQQNPQVETLFEITEFGDDNNEGYQQAPTNAAQQALPAAHAATRPPSQQTPGQSNMRVIAAAPTSAAPSFISRQSSRPVQSQHDVPAPAVASSSASTRQPFAIEGSGSAAPPSSQALSKSKKPKSPSAPEQLEYNPSSSQ